MSKTENNLEIFSNKEFGKLQVVTRNGEILFIAKEIVTKLGYDCSVNSYTKYVKQYVDDDDFVILKKSELDLFGMDDVGRKGEYLITEPGLYSLVLESEIPSSKRFKRWITKEVLPTIRKHGIYADDNTIELMLNDPDSMIKVLTELKSERNQRISLQKENASLLPDAELARDIIKYSGLYTLKEVADLIELGRTELCTLLRIKKVLSKQTGFNLPLNKYIKQGYFKIKINEKHNTPVTLVTSRGLKFIYRLIKKCNLLEDFDTETLLEVAKETGVA